MSEEDPLVLLILDILRRRRRVTLTDILNELFVRVTPSQYRRVRNIMQRLEEMNIVVRKVEPVRGPVFRYVWYDLRPLGRQLRPGRRIRPAEIAQFLGIPLEDTREFLVPELLRRRYLIQVGREVYAAPPLYRVQKFRIYSTGKRPEYYRVVFHRTVQVPRQMVLDGFTTREETNELAIGTIGAVRIVVYTLLPEDWKEERMEEVFRRFLENNPLTFEQYRRNITAYQAYESRPVEPDEKPPDVDLDSPQIFLWVSKEGYTYAYEFEERPGGWSYRRYRVS